MGFFKKFSKNKINTSSTKLVPGVGRLPYPAYRGKDKYIFVSYAHMDHELVFEQIKLFNEAGFHVWYDEGIAPGNEWTKEIANALQNCSLFVVMITPDSAVRRNVQNEINFAVNRNLPFVAIHLKETILPPDMELQIGVLQAIMRYNMSDEEYIYKFIAAFERLGMKRSKQPNSPVSVPNVHKLEPPEKNICNDTPDTAKKRTNGDIVRINGYDVEHGALIGYFGNDKDLVIPEQAKIIHSTAFRNCNSFVESIDLNRAGCVLNHAFENCHKLHSIKVPPTVTTFKPNAIINCPNVTLYIRRDQLPEGYEDVFTGKKIVYLDEPSVQSAKNHPAVQAALHAESTVPEIALPDKEHRWGNYVPKGTAYIKTTDGTTHTAIANSLIFCTKNVQKWTTGPNVFEGLQTQDDSSGNPGGELVYFSDMESVRKIGENLIVTDIDDEKSEIVLHDEAEIWFIGEKDALYPSTVLAKDISEIAFDRSKTPSTVIRYGIITTTEGSFLSPYAFIWFRANVSRSGIPSMVFTKDLSSVSSVPLNFKRVKNITVTKNGTDNSMFPEDMEMTATLKNGEEASLALRRYGSFYAMSANGTMRVLSRAELKAIEILPIPKGYLTPPEKFSFSVKGSYNGAPPSFVINEQYNMLERFIGYEENVIVPDNVIAIAPGAFKGSKIRSVEIPPNVIAIADYAFEDCEELKVVKLSQGLREIGSRAFFGCHLDYIKIPPSVNDIGGMIIDDDDTKVIVVRDSYAMDFFMSYSNIETVVVNSFN